MPTEALAGQYLDALTQACGDETPETALRIDRYKTAAYTVERPLQLDAAIGNPLLDNTTVTQIRELLIELGAVSLPRKPPAEFVEATPRTVHSCVSCPDPPTTSSSSAPDSPGFPPRCTCSGLAGG